MFGTGLAFSFPRYSYDLPYPDLPVDQRDVLVYNGKNNYRMPCYHRLDLAANLRIPGKQVDQVISAGVYNVYNRQNPAYYDIQTRIISEGNSLYKTNSPNQVNFVPILPYLNYSITNAEGLPAGVNPQDPVNQVGELVFNLGNISEDVLKDNRILFNLQFDISIHSNMLFKLFLII